MTKSPITLQELRRRIYVKAKAEKSWRFLRQGFGWKRWSILKRILRKYVDYYHSCRTHLSLEKDTPEPRRVESPAMGKVRAIPKVGGLHHYYTRHAAA